MFRINEIDEEYLTYRTLATEPNIMEMYKQTWKRIHSIPVYETHVCARVAETYRLSHTGENVHEQYVLTRNSDWPELIMLPEEIIGRREPVYYVGVDFDYFQEHIILGKFPDVNINVTEIPYPMIVPYHDPYGYSVRLDTKEDIFALEGNKNGGEYLLTAPCQFRGPLIPLHRTNLYPTQEESYSACFTNKYIAEVYAKSVETYITRLAEMNRDRIINEKYRFN